MIWRDIGIQRQNKICEDTETDKKSVRDINKDRLIKTVRDREWYKRYRNTATEQDMWRHWDR